MRPDDRERLVRQAVPARWLLGHGLLFLVGSSALVSAYPARVAWDGSLARLSSTALLELSLLLGLVATGVALGGVAALWLRERARARYALARRIYPWPETLAVATAVLDPHGPRPLRGALLLTADHVEFVACGARHAARDLRWPLAELDGLETARERGPLARLLDQEGSLVLTRGAEQARLSFVGRSRVLPLLIAAWDRARAT